MLLQRHSAIGLGDVQQALLWALAGETCPTWLNKQVCIGLFSHNTGTSWLDTQSGLQLLTALHDTSNLAFKCSDCAQTAVKRCCFHSSPAHGAWHR